MISLNPIWTFGLGGGEQNAPLRVFAKCLKNGLPNLYETLRLLRIIIGQLLKLKV